MWCGREIETRLNRLIPDCCSSKPQSLASLPNILIPVYRIFGFPKVTTRVAKSAQQIHGY